LILIISNELEQASVLIHFEFFFMPSVISYINLSWAVVGIIDNENSAAKISIVCQTININNQNYPTR